MKLSDLTKNIEEVEVFRDSEFDCVDFLNSSLNKKILTFIENEEYILSLSKNISCIICNKEMRDRIPKDYGIIVSKNPRSTFYTIHNFISEIPRLNKKTQIGENCTISEDARIASNNVNIGKNVIIEDFVVIRENVYIGDNTIIRSGAKIGGEGFQFNKDEKRFFIKHIGGVIIGNNVEIQYNTCIDKAVFQYDNTIIGDNTKIDNLVHVGHGVKIGKNCLITAGVTIAGSTVIENDCWIGVGANISNSIKIKNQARVNIGAVVTKNVKEKNAVTGNFAIDHSKFIEFIKSIR